MLRLTMMRFGGGSLRKVAPAIKPHPAMKPIVKPATKPVTKITVKVAAKPVAKPKTKRATKAKGTKSKSTVTEEASHSDPDSIVNVSARPAYMTAEREREVLNMAERMQKRDLSGEVPVAAFAYDIIKAHPSIREMGLRERMDFLCSRWKKLSKAKRLEYINDPLKGLL